MRDEGEGCVVRGRRMSQWGHTRGSLSAGSGPRVNAAHWELWGARERGVPTSSVFLEFTPLGEHSCHSGGNMCKGLEVGTRLSRREGSPHQGLKSIPTGSVGNICQSKKLGWAAE